MDLKEKNILTALVHELLLQKDEAGEDRVLDEYRPVVTKIVEGGLKDSLEEKTTPVPKKILGLNS